MRITYDKEADAAYIYLNELPSQINKSIQLHQDITIDHNPATNTIRGIEILNVTGCLKKLFPIGRPNG